MHVRKTLTVRNPLKPVPERLPCKLTRDEKNQRMESRLALERTADELDSKVVELKSKHKAKVAELTEQKRQHLAEMRRIREQILNGTETRMVDCLLLEDLEEGVLYTFRLDTGEVVTAKDIRPEELRELRSRLPLGDLVEKTVDIPDGIERVKRFDSDPPGVDDDEPDDDASSSDTDEPDEGGDEKPEGYGHECTYDDGECAVCGEAEPTEEGGAAAVEPAQVRRRRAGESKRKSRGYDSRPAPELV